jgi:hypothetical protein
LPSLQAAHDICVEKAGWTVVPAALGATFSGHLRVLPAVLVRAGEQGRFKAPQLLPPCRLVKAGLLPERYSWQLTRLSNWGELVGYVGSITLRWGTCSVGSGSLWPTDCR